MCSGPIERKYGGLRHHEELAVSVSFEPLSVRPLARSQSGRRRMPLDSRLQIYNEAVRLKSESFTYSQIRSLIKGKYHQMVPKGTISGWLSGKNTPRRAGHAIVLKPTPDLAYVIGAKAGDASLNVKTAAYQYRIRLKAMDPEFVEAFSRSVAAALGCRLHRLWHSKSTGEFYVEYGSYVLYQFLRKPLNVLVPFIEHDVACVAAFLRGFFDSEGYAGKDGAIRAFNTNLQTLGYVMRLLGKHLQIETTGPHLGTRKGSILTRRGKTYHRNADCFSIYIRRDSLVRFHEVIGFTIRRKRLRLQKLLGSSKFAESAVGREERGGWDLRPGQGPLLPGPFWPWDSNPRVP